LIKKPQNANFMNTSTLNVFYAALVAFAAVISPTKTMAQDPPLIFDFCDVYGEPGDTVCVPIICTNFTDVISMQWSMHFDPTFMKFVEDKFNEDLPSDGNLTTESGLVDQGLLIMPWYSIFGVLTGASLDDGVILVELCFEIQQNASGYSEIEVSGSPVIIEAYRINIQEATVEFNTGGVHIGQAPPIEEVTLGLAYEVPICQDSTAFLCADIPTHFPSQGIQYHWYTEDGTLVESNTGCLAVTANSAAAYTSYYCEITPPIPCIDTLYRSALITAVEQQEEECQPVVSIREVNRSSPLHLHPNPTSGAFTLTLPAAAQEGMQVRITDMYGRELSLPGQSKIRAGTWQHTLDASHLPAGVYWVSVHRDGGEVYGGKLVVQ
jgi:hypothetical protein